MGDCGYLENEFKRRYSTELQEYFEEKPADWKETKGEAAHAELLAALMEWGSVVPGSALWESIERQILFKAEKYNVSPMRITDALFAEESADMFMFLLQA